MKSENQESDSGKDSSTIYEEVATELLNRLAEELGLDRVEGKQTIIGKLLQDTSCTIDAKAVVDGGERFLIVECRRHTTKAIDQEQMHGLAFRVINYGADGGIIVSPLGLQEGAKKVANGMNILEVRLTAESTVSDFALQVLDKLFLGFTATATLSAKVCVRLLRQCPNCGETFPEKESHSCFAPRAE